MKIIVTAKEVLEKYDWEKFCDIMELNCYCVNEGMDEEEEFTLTVEQAEEIGIKR